MKSRHASDQLHELVSKPTMKRPPDPIFTRPCAPTASRRDDLSAEVLSDLQTKSSYNQVESAVLGEREIMAPPFGNRCAVVHARELAAASPFVVDLARVEV